MKRFTETEKWRDPWFQKLDKESRTLWLWLCDRVDNSGVVDVCWPICNAETSGNFSDESMTVLGSRVEKLNNGKWWIPGFVSFQVGKLSSHCKPHIYIMDLIKKHGLEDRVGYRVCDKVPCTFKEKEQEKEQEKEKEQDTSSSLNGADLALQGLRPPNKTVPPGRHTLLKLWCSEYCKSHDGEAYHHVRSKDDRSMDELLSKFSAEKIIQQASKGWGSKNDFIRQVSSTLEGLNKYWNEISNDSKSTSKPSPVFNRSAIERGNP